MSQSNMKNYTYPIYINALKKMVNIEASSMYMALEQAKLIEKASRNIATLKKGVK